MLIKVKRGWELPDSAATDESVFLNRRKLVAALGLGPLVLGGLTSISGRVLAEESDPTANLYPAKRNEAYTLDRPLTDEKDVTSYNNFYEFGGDKRIASRAQKLKVRPWEVVIDGMVEKEIRISFDDLVRRMPLEERLYRHRCVEAWSMAVPWTGFPMKALVELAKPLGSAKYVRMETLVDRQAMQGLHPRFPWPYVEGLTIAEATNELAFIATGLYGKPMPKQNGAPLRLAVPWKYGFKSIKSIVRVNFTDERPKSFWQSLQGGEYGFWANVNPEVPHRRWSQADEEVLGTGERVPTLLYNGYAEQVAGLYAGMKGEELFM